MAEPVRNWMIGVSTPFNYLNENNFYEYKQCGINAFEVVADEHEYELLDLIKIVSAAERNGILPWSFHLSYYVPISNPREEKRQSAVQYHKEWIRRAAGAGFRYIVVHPSFEPIMDEHRQEEFIASKKSLAELAEVCKENSVILAAENLPRTCLANTSKELLALIKDIDGVGVCFDVNHLTKETPEEFLKAVADKLVTVHLSDYDRIDERHWLPGEGIIDWSALLKDFEEIGYKGPLMYEVDREANFSVSRDSIITPRDFAKNANEMINGLPLTKHGKVLL